MADGRGGVREGAGRKRILPEDERFRKIRSIRASDSEWETIRAFDKILKKNPERAAQMVLEAKIE